MGGVDARPSKTRSQARAPCCPPGVPGTFEQEASWRGKQQGFPQEPNPELLWMFYEPYSYRFLSGETRPTGQLGMLPCTIPLPFWETASLFPAGQAGESHGLSTVIPPGCLNLSLGHPHRIGPPITWARSRVAAHRE